MGDISIIERRTVASLADLIQNRFGAKTDYRINPMVEEVDIAVTQIFNNNPKRFGLVVVNMSGNTVYLAPDAQVSAARGFLLVPNGGSIHFNWIEDFQLCMLPYYGMSTGDNSDIFSLEVFCV